MQALTLPARRGWRWLVEGFGIFRKKRLVLSLLILAYWMLMLVISAFPMLGQLVATLLIPVFSVSLMNACRLVEQGAPLPPQLLFSGFHQNLRALLTLGAIYIAASLIILALTALIDGGALFKLTVLGHSPDDPALGDGITMSAVAFALLLFSPLMMAYWYAPVLVAWHNLTPGKSLFFSFVASARNWRAFLTYAMTIMIFGAILPGLVVGLLSSAMPSGGELLSFVMTALFVLILMPTLYASFYVSYRDVFVTIDDDA